MSSHLKPIGSPQARRTVLTIAGHDPSGGAGITADLLTFSAHGLFGTSAITALTVQSTLGVAASVSTSADFLRRALNHLCADLPPSGIKIGMLGSSEVVTVVAEFLAAQRARVNGLQVPVVLDPVLRASSGADLLPPEALNTMRSRLLPVVDWITPNRAELAALTGARAHSEAEAQAAALELQRVYPQMFVVTTGGDQAEPVDLLLQPDGQQRRFPGEHIRTTSTHGTGCAFSSALLSRLVLGDDPATAVAAAKSFVTEALCRAPGLGHGRGPLHLLWPLDPTSIPE